MPAPHADTARSRDGVVARIVAEVYRICRADGSGALADYIPELAAVQPDSFGLCLATADGRVYGSGDLDTRFTIQSISKPFTYALALADRGPAAVAERIDVEPSGEPFFELSLDPGTQRPRNPMINAGAIAAAALVTGRDAADRFERVRRSYSRFAGRELRLNEACTPPRRARATATAPSAICCVARASSTAIRTRRWTATSGSAPSTSPAATSR